MRASRVPRASHLYIGSLTLSIDGFPDSTSDCFSSFVSVITGCILGFVVLKVRRLKPFIVMGTVLFMVAFGLLIRYRGGTEGSSHSGVVGAQVLLGIAGGLFPYPAQASIQAATKHERTSPSPQLHFI